MDRGRTVCGVAALLVVLAHVGAGAALAQVAPVAADTTILPPQEIGTIVLGQARAGMLEAGDYTMSDGTWADVWYVNVAAGQRITVDCRPRGFNAYLQLLNPWGSKVAEDAGGGGGAGARLSHTVSEAGRYQIVVNNYSDVPQPGTYVLSIR